MTIGEPAEPRGRSPVCRSRVIEVGEGVSGEAVGAALEDDELGLGVVDVSLDPLPSVEEGVVARARWQWDIELGSLGCARTGLVDPACARIEKAAVFLTPWRERRISMAIPQSLKTQNPPASWRRAWWSPAMGTKAR